MQFAALARRPGGRLTGVPPLRVGHYRYLETARRLARFMDAQWGLGRFRFGAESVIGLIPVWGDLMSAFAGVYLLWVAIQLRMPARAVLRMLANTALDLGIGMVPVAGDIADTVFKSHMKNYRLIEAHARSIGIEPRR